MKDFQAHMLSVESTIKEALQSLNKISQSNLDIPLNLFVVDDTGRMKGALTDGDIRRGLVSGVGLDDKVSQIMNRNFHYLQNGECPLNKVKEFRDKQIGLVPILDNKDTIRNVLDLTKKKSLLPIDAVLMAGGEGKRLRPLTKEKPKPLLDVGDKPIIAHIIDRIDQFGIPELTISVRYKAKQLIEYFEKNRKQWELNISFVKEDTPLGTIGALSLIEEFEHNTVLLSNADILSTINYENFYEFFLETDADAAVASVPYNVRVPYGIFNTNGTEILSLQEKPEYTYYSNAGIYLFKRELMSEIPKNEYVDVTDFLKFLISNDFKVTYFPILGYWQDIGRREDFSKVQKDINLIEV